ncbi:hypothetical protein HDE_04566 [Halotydeus destructor]|nr:hypothetical protein HDE_04566 [Halotydeus destructor]
MDPADKALWRRSSLRQLDIEGTSMIQHQLDFIIRRYCQDIIGDHWVDDFLGLPALFPYIDGHLINALPPSNLFVGMPDVPDTDADEVILDVVEDRLINGEWTIAGLTRLIHIGIAAYDARNELQAE